MSDSRKSNSICDLLVFAAHPDDAELCCGGLLLLSADRGWRTGVVDMTRGELGSLGNPEIRMREAEVASGILGLTVRKNLGLSDGHLHDCDAHRKEVVRVIREIRPRVVVAPPREDHHADHMATSEIVRRSFYLCGVRKYLPDLEPWRPRALLYYTGSRPVFPQLVVDITDVFERRMEAVKCYESQFGNPQPGSPLRISSPHFLESVRGHLVHYGALIGVAYGEAFTGELPLPVTDLLALFEVKPWKSR